MIDKASQPKDFSMNYLSYLKTLIDDLCVEKISSFIELILKKKTIDYFFTNNF